MSKDTFVHKNFCKNKGQVRGLLGFTVNKKVFTEREGGEIDNSVINEDFKIDGETQWTET